MATLFNCPGCGQKLRLQAGFEAYWMQCPACAGTFVPQLLPFRLATAEEGASVDECETDQEEDEEGVWQGSFSELRRDCEPHRSLWIALLGSSSLLLGSMAMIL